MLSSQQNQPNHTIKTATAHSLTPTVLLSSFALLLRDPLVSAPPNMNLVPPCIYLPFLKLVSPVVRTRPPAFGSWLSLLHSASLTLFSGSLFIYQIVIFTPSSIHSLCHLCALSAYTNPNYPNIYNQNFSPNYSLLYLSSTLTHINCGTPASTICHTIHTFSSSVLYVLSTLRHGPGADLRLSVSLHILFVIVYGSI